MCACVGITLVEANACDVHISCLTGTVPRLPMEEVARHQQSEAPRGLAISCRGRSWNDGESDPWAWNLQIATVIHGSGLDTQSSGIFQCVRVTCRFFSTHGAVPGRATVGGNFNRANYSAAEICCRTRNRYGRARGYCASRSRRSDRRLGRSGIG